METTASSTKQPSCIVCRRRKVKCDRKFPCTNCIRLNAECVFRETIPARHHKRRAEHALLSKLRHYEDLLRQHGIDPGVVGNDDSAATTTTTSTTSTAERNAEDIQHGMSALHVSGSSSATKPLTGQFVSKGGKSIYLENDVWNTLGNELEESDYISDESGAESADNFSTPRGIELPGTFDRNDHLFIERSDNNLKSLHPNPVQVFRLWQAFLEDIDPVTKIVHPPHLQQQILTAIGNLNSVDRELEALMFSIYCCALLSMTEEEVKENFGSDRSSLQARYRIVTQKALANAGLLKTSDLKVLQAFCLYLVACRSAYDRRTVWCLSGTAMRIAQQMGLHRDGSQLGLSIFETEMRRRVWWHIVYMDRSITRSSGYVAPPLPTNDTRFPLSVNDNDLHPDMKELPSDRNDVATDMIYCRLQHELGKWKEHQPRFIESVFSDNASQTPSHSDQEEHQPQIENEMDRRKQRAIDGFKSTLHEKVIRFCDPSIPLHMYVRDSAHTIITTMQLVASRPFHVWGPDLKLPAMSQAESDELYLTCLDLIAHNAEMRKSKAFQRYIWHLDWHMPWAILLYVVSRLSKQSILSEKTQRAWHCVDELFLPCLQRLAPEARGLLHIVVLRLAAKAWNAHVDESRRLGMGVPLCPRIVALLTRYNSSTCKTTRHSSGLHSVSLSISQTTQQKEQGNSHTEAITPTVPVPSLLSSERTDDSIRFMDVLDESPKPLADADNFVIDWNEWDSFFQQDVTRMEDIWRNDIPEQL